MDWHALWFGGFDILDLMFGEFEEALEDYLRLINDGIMEHEACLNLNLSRL